MALEVKKFEKGTCFICGKQVEENYYAHGSCCLAYQDEKEKRLREYNQEKESKMKHL